MTAFTTAPDRLPAPLAEHAATAARPAGPCALCRRPIVTWERYAALVPSKRLAHVRCIGAGAAQPRP